MAKADDLYINIRIKDGQVDPSLRKVEGKLNGFGNNIDKISRKFAGMFAGYIGVTQLSALVKESVVLAGQAEGIKEAFDHLNQPGLLARLRESTRGAVSDLRLMQATVKANNFKIALDQLPTFFEFATKRAAQTGEAVDYLVDSIILGIGRKSPLILDNLGISAIALREKFHGLGIESASIGDVAKAMGEIVDDELKKMGDVSVNTGTKLQRMGAVWTQIKIDLGEAVANSQVFMNTLNGIGRILQIINKGNGVSHQVDTYIGNELANLPQGIEARKKYLQSAIADYQSMLADFNSKFQSQLPSSGLEAWFNQTITNTGITNMNEGLETTGRQINIFAQVIAALKKKLDEIGKGNGGGLEIIPKKTTEQLIMDLTMAEDHLDILKQSLKDADTPEAFQNVLKSLKEAQGEVMTLNAMVRSRGVTDTIPALLSPAGTSNVSVTGTANLDLSSVFDGDAIIEHMHKQMTKVREALNADAQSLVDQLNQTLNQGVVNAMSSFLGGLGQLAVGGDSIKSIGAQFLSTMGSIMVQFGGALILWGLGWKAFQKAPLIPHMAIVAGALLTVAGGAIKGIASNVSAGNYGGAYGTGGSSGYTYDTRSGDYSRQNRIITFKIQNRDFVAMVNATDLFYNRQG